MNKSVVVEGVIDKPMDRNQTTGTKHSSMEFTEDLCSSEKKVTLR